MINCKLYRCFHMYAIAVTHQLNTTAGTGAKWWTIIFAIIICCCLGKCNSCRILISSKYIFRTRKHAQQQNVNGKQLCKEFHTVKLKHETNWQKNIPAAMLQKLNLYSSACSYYHQHTTATAHRFKIKINTHNCSSTHLLCLLLQLGQSTLTGFFNNTFVRTVAAAYNIPNACKQIFKILAPIMVSAVTIPIYC